MLQLQLGKLQLSQLISTSAYPLRWWCIVVLCLLVRLAVCNLIYRLTLTSSTLQIKINEITINLYFCITPTQNNGQQYNKSNLFMGTF